MISVRSHFYHSSRNYPDLLAILMVHYFVTESIDYIICLSGMSLYGLPASLPLKWMLGSGVMKIECQKKKATLNKKNPNNVVRRLNRMSLLHVEIVISEKLHKIAVF